MLNIKQHKSPNFSDRKPGCKIDTIILHHTAVEECSDVLRVLSSPAMQVSAHYVVDRNGDIYQLVDESKIAWHAGVSSWHGRESMNKYSIGIEIVNTGFEEFPDAQMHAVIELCKDIKQRHNIEDRNIIAHADVAPNRKVDPSEYFKWHDLYKEGLGIYSELTIESPKQTIKHLDVSDEIVQLREDLHRFGYKVDVSKNVFDQELYSVSAAFKRHYSQESYNISGWDELADARLHDLLEHYYA